MYLYVQQHQIFTIRWTVTDIWPGCCQLVTEETQVHSQGSPCKTLDGQSGNDMGPMQFVFALPVTYKFIFAPYLLTIWG